jgi:type IV fimbrial biogenesis protein FimT
LTREIRLRGFTLIELLVVLAVAAVLMAVGVPNLRNITLSNRLTANTASLADDIRFSRTEAIKRNATVTVCASSGGTACQDVAWSEGWIVVVGTSVLTRKEAFTDQLKAIGGTRSVAFAGSGLTTNAMTVTVCQGGSSVGKQERVLSVSASGRVNVTTTTAGVCA